MAAKLGYANAEIFPKQNKVDMNKGGTGSFLNLPYHNAKYCLLDMELKMMGQLWT